MSKYTHPEYYDSGFDTRHRDAFVMRMAVHMMRDRSVKSLRAELSIINESAAIDCGENVGGSTASPAAPEVAAEEDDGDGDGDPDSEPPHRTRKPRSTPRAAASCGTADLGDPLAFSVAEFCEKHRITKPHLYELFKRGTGPRIMKVGRRTLISIEAAADWRRQMEQGAQLSRRCA